ncbi:MAG: DUF1513 domain-containing protein [Pseudomonadales bacterium]|nr:DUF1513 domain-containing protein [Pseudomonadales bacterium]
MLIIGSGKLNNKWVLSAINSTGHTLYQKKLPKRAHHISKNKNNSHGLVIARRPGNYARLFDSKTGQTIKEINAPNNHFFFGHSCFSKNNIIISCGDQTSLGKLAIYDLALNFEYFIELNNYGPHQIELINNNQIAVAVGGLQTIERKILNMEDFKSELIIVDVSINTIINRYKLANSKLSIRHLHTHNSKVIVAAQLPDRDTLFENLNTALIYELKDNQLKAIIHPNWNTFKQYIASISFDDTHLIATSPKGHTLGIWSISDNAILFDTQLSFVDVAGITQFQNTAFWSTGLGYSSSKYNDVIITSKQEIHWDNHWNTFYV